MNRGISSSRGILIIVVFAFLIGGILVWQFEWFKEEIKVPEVKTPEKAITEETADWKTYKNEEYGFEVKYPEDWILVPSERSLEGAKLFIGFRRSKIVPTLEDYKDILVRVREQNQPLDQPIYDEVDGAWWRIVDGEEIVVSGLKAYYFRDVDGPIGGVDDVYFSYGGNLFQITAIPFEEGDETHRIIFNQILATFRFLK